MRRMTSELVGIVRTAAAVTVALLGVVATSGAEAGQAQSGAGAAVTMSQLTPALAALPAGCVLKSLAPVPQPAKRGEQPRIFYPVASMQPPGAKTNPWVGTDELSLAWLRLRVDGTPEYRMPDAPLMDRVDELEVMRQLAEGIVEGYAATYAQSHAPDIGVQAVRFAPGISAMPLVFDRTSRPGDRYFDLGTLRIGLIGDNGACAKAIETHLRGLGAILNHQSLK